MTVAPLIQVQPLQLCYQYPNFNEIVTFRQHGEVQSTKEFVNREWKVDITETFRQQEVLGKIIKWISWCPPEPGCFKINTDGAYKSSIDLAGAGGLIRNSKGKWCGGFSINLGGSLTALEVELVGILRGLELAWDMKFRNIILESDCKIAVDLLNARDSDDQALRQSITVFHLVQNIKKLLGREWNWKIQHQYREGNQAADWLANHGIWLSRYRKFLLPPPGIEDHLNKDLFGVPFPRLCKI